MNSVFTTGVVGRARRFSGRAAFRVFSLNGLLASLPLTTGCSVTRLGFLNEMGSVASGERHLFLVVVLVLIFVAGPVLILTPVFAWHYRLANSRNAFRPQWSFSWVLEFFIWIPPTVIVAGLAVLLWHGSRALDPYTPIPSTAPPIEIQVVALDWKWLFIYPDSGIVTVNELDIPAGRSIHLTLTSGTVLQSLFIPQLAGQIYAMPGMTTQLNLIASKPGIFSGENTQFNGVGFPRDTFKVVSLDPSQYSDWTLRLQAQAAPLDRAVLQHLSFRGVEPHALFFRASPPGLFESFRSLTHPETRMTDHDESAP